MRPQLMRRTAIDALTAVGEDVTARANSHDLAYFQHRPRYQRNLERIDELCPVNGRVLDIGSHYLHTACALTAMGFQVVGMDVSAFAEAEIVRDRARRFHVENIAVDDLAAGDFLPGQNDSFDLVVFSEILEHITFNPVRFWKRVYEVLRPGGAIYLTTPNALTPWKIMSTIKRAILLEGIGITIPMIFRTVTYGHHWKEYSSSEVRRYFQMLSPDFEVSVRTYSYRPPPPSGFSAKAATRSLCVRLSQAIPAFRDELDVVVRLRDRTTWSLESPQFI
jgi:SAM-dependent methyltransferase